MSREQSLQILLDLFAAKTVVDLPAIRVALGGVSAMTAFRYLRRVRYRRSYNHNGRYYTSFEPSRFDRFGLWSFGGVHFSVDGSLRGTVRRMVHEADGGVTHKDLGDRLRVRVHNTLLRLLREGEIDREPVGGVYLYVHPDPEVRGAQLQRRRERIAASEAVAGAGEDEVGERVVIRVLLMLLRHPGERPSGVARRLRGHSPPITYRQVRAVFARYRLDEIGEKGGPAIS